MFQFFQHEEGGSFAHHKAVTSGVEGAGSAFGIVVAGGKGPQGAESADGKRGHPGLSAAADDDIGIAILDGAEGGSDGVVGAGAGAGNAEVGAFEAVFYGDVGGGYVGYHFGDEKGADAARALQVVFDGLFLEGVDSADAHSGDHAYAAAVLPGRIYTSVLNSLAGRHHGKVGEGIHLAGFLEVEMLFGMKIFYLGGDLGGKG
ncbi:MAG: hypothetical protein BWX83_00405 [Candidatus Cloacimonetes bacterium ADurb.Bin117]|nr:MAG: hypothetical protein BWX83_00405 [Candidatus Cloacimonetes bacterium ADurb.Bin117]